MRFTGPGGCVLFAALLPLMVSDVSRADFRCGTRLVSEGVTKAEVLHRCGEPDYRESWKEDRVTRDFYTPVFRQRDWEYARDRDPFLVTEHVMIESWTYNSGSTRFVRYLRFENGILRDISVGTYGY